MLPSILKPARVVRNYILHKQIKKTLLQTNRLSNSSSAEMVRSALNFRIEFNFHKIFSIFTRFTTIYCFNQILISSQSCVYFFNTSVFLSVEEKVKLFIFIFLQFIHMLYQQLNAKDLHYK